MKFISVSYTPSTHSLKVISYTIFNHFVHGTKFHTVKFSTCNIIAVLKKFQSLEYFRFEVRDAQPTRSCLNLPSGRSEKFVLH